VRVVKGEFRKSSGLSNGVRWNKQYKNKRGGISLCSPDFFFEFRVNYFRFDLCWALD